MTHNIFSTKKKNMPGLELQPKITSPKLSQLRNITAQIISMKFGLWLVLPAALLHLKLIAVFVFSVERRWNRIFILWWLLIQIQKSKSYLLEFVSCQNICNFVSLYPDAGSVFSDSKTCGSNTQHDWPDLTCIRKAKRSISPSFRPHFP